jgi:hypothetical protein
MAALPARAQQTETHVVGLESFPRMTTIYRASGVRNTATTPNHCIATVVPCTNWSNQSVRIRYEVRDASGAVLASTAISMNAKLSIGFQF